MSDFCKHCRAAKATHRDDGRCDPFHATLYCSTFEPETPEQRLERERMQPKTKDELALAIGRRTLRERIRATRAGAAAIRLNEILYAPRGSGFVLLMKGGIPGDYPAISEEGEKFLREVADLLEEQAFHEVEEQEK